MPAKSYTYLLIDLCCIIIPLIASFHKKSPFYKNWQHYFPANIAVAVFFLIWDGIFTQWEVWGFNEDYITGIHLFNLPLEEVLFFICIPYACAYTYYVFSKYSSISFPVLAWRISYFLAAALILVAIFYRTHLYTATTFFLLSLLLVGLSNKRVFYLDKFFIVYLIILIPFFISNGLLTGSWLAKPIVWYDDNHNLGMRMLTIPVDDAFYAMLLLLMNIAGYEWLKNRRSVQTGETV